MTPLMEFVGLPSASDVMRARLSTKRITGDAVTPATFLALGGLRSASEVTRASLSTTRTTKATR